MSAKSQKKIGDDPLSWLHREASRDMASQITDPPPEAPATVTVEPRKGRGRAGKRGAVTAPSAEDLIETSFSLLTPRAEELVANFYTELFQRYPEVEPLFAGSSRTTQEGKLLAALKLAVGNIRKPEALQAALADMGRRHQGYGALPAHYEAVSTTLIDVMATMAGEDWNEDLARAWQSALAAISNMMQAGYEQESEQQLAVVASAQPEPVVAAPETPAELNRLRAAVDGAMTAIMMVDRELVITYVNRATVDLMQRHQDTLQTIYPGFDAEQLVGSCIDMFHQNPGHQRSMLDNPANLPHRTDISLGPLRFALNVTAIVDDNGDYLGNTLEWADVTQERASEREVAQLKSAIDGAMTAIMMVDRDFIITYVNDATVKLLGEHQSVMREIYPGFDADRMIGTCIDSFHARPDHQRQMLADPRNLPWRTDIAVGPLKFSLNVTAIVDAHGDYLGNSLEWADVTETRSRELEVARLQSAIDAATTNLMLCDENLDIVYANPAVMAMFRNRATELRQAFSGFDPEQLVGQNIDQFHKNPSHQRKMLQSAALMPAKAKIHVLDLVFEVNASMIAGPKGEYKGNIVEWLDITEQYNAETELSALVDAASTGDFSVTMDIDKYQGFYRQLGGTINGMMMGLQDISQVLASLSQGDLTCGMNREYEGLFARIQVDVNGTVDVLRDMVRQILDSSSNISHSSGEISDGNSDLLQRTESQASSLEETASSMEQMTAAVKSSADNARQANQLAASARQQAETGGEVVTQAIDAMVEINKSSSEIADIISVIDEIAFQTNLLALNAAVEAARAGEQGRGFAVVAAEVRNLAQRSAEAAKEIKVLIKDSVVKVDDGSRLVDASGKTLTEIVTAVKKVSDIIAEIAAASQEQSQGIEQVNAAISQLDEVTQKNAAMVEQAAAASESMDEQSRGLIGLMDFFDLGDAEETVPARRPAQVTARQISPARRPVVGQDRSSAAGDTWEQF